MRVAFWCSLEVRTQEKVKGFTACLGVNLKVYIVFESLGKINETIDDLMQRGSLGFYRK